MAFLQTDAGGWSDDIPTRCDDAEDVPEVDRNLDDHPELVKVPALDEVP